jgi:hypothetical protein
MKFGSFYIHLDKIAYVHKFTPEVLPASAVKARNIGGVRMGFDNNELIIYEDEPGYAEFVAWLDSDTIGLESEA